MIYTELAKKETVQKVVEELAAKNVEAIVVETGAEALSKIKELVPKGVSITNGSSVTLEQIGFVNYLKGAEHPWHNLHAAIVAETDPDKKLLLRKQASLSDYYLGSIHALAETGEFIVASNSGSQLPHVVFTSPNVIFVVSTKKIVPTLSDAMDRLYKHVIPLEEVHMQQKYKVSTFPSKIVIWNRESPNSGRQIRMILVNEDLGF